MMNPNARPPSKLPQLQWDKSHIISQPTMSFGKINFVNVEHAGGKKPAKVQFSDIVTRVFPQPIGNATASVPIGKDSRRFFVKFWRKKLHLVNFIRNN